MDFNFFFINNFIEKEVLIKHPRSFEDPYKLNHLFNW